MAHKKHASHDEELPFVALMDTMTNVVGVLIIVLVMIGISLASSVKKVLSELPPVTVEELQEVLNKLIQSTPKEDPKKLAEEQKKLEEQIKKATSDLKTLDVSSEQALVSMNLEETQKKLDMAKRQRDTKKTATENLLAELDKLKALLDVTPVYKPPPPTVVKLPNPRAFPEKPVQVDYFVSEGRLLTFLMSDYLPPLEKGLDQVRSQLELKDPKPQMFEKLLQDVLKNDRAKMAQAWQAIAPLAGHVQVEDLAVAWNTLSLSGEVPTKDDLAACVNLALGLKRFVPSIPVMAVAMEAASRGDMAPWIAFRPATEKPEAPTFIGTSDGAKVTLGYTSKHSFSVKKAPKDVYKAFDQLAGALDYNQKYREKTLYDADKIKAMLARAFESPVLPKDFTGEIVDRPTASFLQIKFTPRPEAAETVEQALLPTSKFRRGMAAVKSSPNGVVWFKVLRDSLAAYVQAREVAEEMAIPAGWEIVNAFDASAELRAFEVPKRERTPPRPPPPPNAPTVRIEPPKKTLD